MKAKDVARYLQIMGGSHDPVRDLDAAWIQFWFWRIQQAETHVGSYKLEKYLFGFGLMMGKPRFLRAYTYIPPDHIPERTRGQHKKSGKPFTKILSWQWPMSFMVFYRDHQFAKPKKARLKRDFNGYRSWD